MKKISFFLAMFFIATHVFSQALDYKNNRIAVSADGNNQPDPNPYKGWAPGYKDGDPGYYKMGGYKTADPDDWSATPAALAILGVIAIYYYRIDSAMLFRMEQDLKERHVSE